MDEKQLDMAERVWEQLCTKPGQRTDYISDLIAQAREAVRLREELKQLRRDYNEDMRDAAAQAQHETRYPDEPYGTY